MEDNWEYNLLEEQKYSYGLFDRCKKFVLQVWAFCDEIPSTPTGKNVTYQLTRSASSVGANFRAAFRGRSAKEYIAKLGIALEESDETCYWLELIEAYPKWQKLHGKAKALHKEANELTAIITSLIKKKKQQQ
ncbi:MAG: four helix bundle protein [Bacteroidota bacterium]